MTVPSSNSTDRIYRVLIVDDHPTICEGLSHRINAQLDMTVCATAACFRDAMEAVGSTSPDIAIIDIALKNSDGLELIKAIVPRYPLIRTVVHSMYEENIYADRCLRAGAHGYVNKEADPQDVIRAIREIMAGRIYLSPQMTSKILTRRLRGAVPEEDLVTSLSDRQLEIFRLIGEGGDARSIAQRLHISVHTVETHRENIKRKLTIEKLPELNRRAVLWVQENR
jgi:DNA-binding NarL/FixJ family response regulator